MPSYPRHALVPSGSDCVLHVVSRCVRRARLCGVDSQTGKDFSHRRHWILGRLRTLCSLFAVEVISYALMENHFHLVLRCRPTVAGLWSRMEVAQRWYRVFGPRDRAPEKLLQRATIAAENEALIEKWRSRLGEVSWFMRCLNEFIARRANAEDRATGRFWEGRFYSQRIEGESALIACMAYVDLNPVRAGLAGSIRGSHFTSGRERLLDLEAKPKTTAANGWLSRMAEASSDSPVCLTTQQYLETLRVLGEQKAPGKFGSIGRTPSHSPPMIGGEALVRLAAVPRLLRRGFPRLFAPPETMEEAARFCGRKWLVGVRLSRSLFSPRSYARGATAPSCFNGGGGILERQTLESVQLSMQAGQAGRQASGLDAMSGCAAEVSGVWSSP